MKIYLSTDADADNVKKLRKLITLHGYCFLNVTTAICWSFFNHYISSRPSSVSSTSMREASANSYDNLSTNSPPVELPITASNNNQPHQ